MTRDRRRPPSLESLEGKLLLSTIRAGLSGPTAGVIRQAASEAVPTASRPSTLGNLTAGNVHSRVTQVGHFATGRMAVLNSVRMGLLGRSLAANVAAANVQGQGQVTGHPNLRAGLLNPVVRMAVASTSAIPSTPGLSSRITRPEAPAPKPIVLPTAPTAQSTLAQTLALSGNLR